VACACQTLVRALPVPASPCAFTTTKQVPVGDPTPMQFVRPKTARVSIEQARGLDASSWAQNALLRTSIFRTPLLACIRQFVVEFDAFYQ
jgi:hypothetical protein